MKAWVSPGGCCHRDSGHTRVQTDPVASYAHVDALHWALSRQVSMHVTVSAYVCLSMDACVCAVHLCACELICVCTWCVCTHAALAVYIMRPVSLWAPKSGNSGQASNICVHAHSAGLQVWCVALCVCGCVTGVSGSGRGVVSLLCPPGW